MGGRRSVLRHRPPLRAGLSERRLGAASGRFAERRVCRVNKGGPAARPQPFSEGVGTWTMAS